MQDKIPDEVLRDCVKKYKSLLEIPSTYRHRAFGSYYEAIDIAFREEDMKPCVLYHSINGPIIKYVRPIDDFIYKFDLIEMSAPVPHPLDI